MSKHIVLAGPTLDCALGLVRLGLIEAKPTNINALERGNCTGSLQQLAKIQQDVPEELKSLLEPSPSHEVHVFIADQRDMHRGHIHHHFIKPMLPEGSFMEIADGVLVPSWPLYFVLKCRELERLSDRLMLGMELCGSYSALVAGDRASAVYFRQPTRTKDGGLTARWDSPKIKPVLTIQGLRMYLEQAKGIRGLGRAREILPFLLERSASPGESTLALMATLPCRMGGYGFCGMVLNPEVTVEPAKRHLTRTDAYHPDGYLEHLKTDLEYESNENHTGKHAVTHDKARRNDIQALGIEVKDVTWEMLSHLDLLDLLFEQLLDKERQMGFDPQGKHARMVRHPDNKALRRIRLQELLPPWPYEA